jgi:hypothetical protein
LRPLRRRSSSSRDGHALHVAVPVDDGAHSGWRGPCAMVLAPRRQRAERGVQSSRFVIWCAAMHFLHSRHLRHGAFFVSTQTDVHWSFPLRPCLRYTTMCAQRIDAQRGRCQRCLHSHSFRYDGCQQFCGSVLDRSRHDQRARSARSGSIGVAGARGGRVRKC